jgi:hypothetical protein
LPPSGVPFTITANGATLNIPGNQQTANPNSIQYGDGTTGNPWGFSSRDVTNPNFGKVFVASGERNIRLGLRFSFWRTRRARVKSALSKVSGPATVGGHLYNSNA